MTGDFDADGRADVALANVSADSVSVLLGLGDGSFIQTASLAVGQFPDFIVSADFNHDGLDDLAVANAGSGTITVLLALPFDAAAALSSLRDNVREMGFPTGLNASLTTQLDRALSALASDETTGACRFLENFMRMLRIQSGRQLTAEQANELTATAQWISGHLPAVRRSGATGCTTRASTAASDPR